MADFQQYLFGRERQRLECIPAILGRNVFFADHSTESDSNFSAAERRRFYALLRVSRPQPDARGALGGYSELRRAIGGIWRAVPVEDEQYVFAIAL